MNIDIIIIPSIFLHFVYFFLGSKEIGRKKLILSYCISVAFAMCVFLKASIPQIAIRPDIRYATSAGPIYNLSVLFYYVAVGFGLYKLYIGYKSTVGLKANQIKYVFWSSLIGFISGTSNYLYVYDKAIPFFNPYATFGVPLYVMIMTYAMHKHRLMEISLVIKKTVIYGLVYSLCLGLFSLIVIILGHEIISGTIDKRIIWLSMVAVFIIVSVVKPLDKLLSSLTDRFLFREKYEYHKTLKEASSGMIRIRDLDKLLKLIVKIITKHVRVTHAAIFLFEKDEGAFVVKASSGRLKIPKDYISIKQANPLLRHIMRVKEPVVCEELKSIFNQDNNKAFEKIILEMERLNISVCVPSFLKGRLMGFLLLGEKLSGEMYSQEDLSLFNTLALQAGLAIENAKSYAEISEAKQRLFEAEKLASIGSLAGGIAHEIKNPLASIKIFTAYLNKKFDDPDFRNKFQRIVGREVDRINHIVEQLITYAHPKRETQLKTDLHKVIEETLDLLENDLEKEHVKVKKLYAKISVKLFTDPQQLKQVFLNLFLNSIQAMENNNGRLRELKISTEKQNGTLKVRISDTGSGIPKDHINKIFDPFFTTKEHGTGLGLAIVKSIVESQNGLIYVESKPSEGTNFIITFHN